MDSLEDCGAGTANQTQPHPLDVESARHDQFRFIPNINFDAE